MEYPTMLQNFESSGQWTDFSLYENDQTYINHENSLKPILSAATFPVSWNHAAIENGWINKQRMLTSLAV
jgi:hypothetical protein